MIKFDISTIHWHFISSGSATNRLSVQMEGMTNVDISAHRFYQS